MIITTQFNVGDTIYYPEVRVIEPVGSGLVATAGELKVASILVNVNKNLSYSIFYKDDKRPCTSVAETGAYRSKGGAFEVAKHMLSYVLGEHNKIKDQGLTDNENPDQRTSK